MRMASFLARRLLGIVIVLLAVSVVTFLIFYIFPSDPALKSCGKPCSPEALATARTVMGLDAPVWKQYLEFLQGLFVGRTYGSGNAAIHCAAPCLGYSFQKNQEVTALIKQVFPVTLSIAIGAAVLWFIGGVVAGLVAALKRGRVADKGIMTVAIVGVSTPSYLLGLLCILLFGFVLNIVPVGGYVPFSSSPVGWLWHMITPWCVLAFISAAIYARLTRSQMLDSLNEDYVRTARAKGLPERKVITGHALRNVLIPVVTIFGMDFGGLLGGAVVTERVFSMYGMGALLIDSVESTDLPVVLGIALLAATFVVVANLIVDIVYKLLDPRV